MPKPQPATDLRPPTIPVCGGCGKQRVLYGGLCSGCVAKGEREEEESRG